MDKEITGNATLKDIAKQLNLSISTVSRALHDHPRISKKTKDSVLKLAREMDYHPNQFALRLLHKKSETIGIMVPKISYNFYSQAITGIEGIATKHGYSILICQSNESFRQESANIDRLLKSQVDGFIISQSAATRSIDHFTKIVDKNIPLVFFNRVNQKISTSKIIINNFKAAYDATQHLIEQGCQNIGFLAGPKTLHISNQRLKGYKSALMKNNLTYREENIRYNYFSRSNAFESTIDLLNQTNTPDGMITFSDTLAIGAILAIKQEGLNIPEDVALVGFNNDPVCDILSPTLSSIDQDPYQLGTIAAKTLFKQIEKGNEFLYKVEEVVLPTSIRIRESSLRKGMKNII